jgi:hypothetical protein
MDASLHGLPRPVVAEDDPSFLDLGQPAQNIVADALLGVTCIDKYRINTVICEVLTRLPGPGKNRVDPQKRNALMGMGFFPRAVSLRYLITAVGPDKLGRASHPARPRDP